ncbi:MAG: serine--tRNA ligase, partial [Candidatus Micrarchaeia archaeon]
MLELKFVRANQEIVKKDLQKRGDSEKLGWLSDLLEKDKIARELALQSEALRNRRNTISREINLVKKEGKDATELLKEAGAIPAKLKETETQLDAINEKIKYYLMRLPNILHESVPVGKDDSENVQIKTWGEAKVPPFELKNHGQLAAEKGWADFERAAKISGAGFYFLKGNLVLLDMALQRFAMDLLVTKGYTPVMPPYMMNRAAYEGVTDLSDFEKVMYKIDGEDEYP